MIKMIQRKLMQYLRRNHLRLQRDKHHQSAIKGVKGFSSLIICHLFILSDNLGARTIILAKQQSLNTSSTVSPTRVRYVIKQHSLSPATSKYLLKQQSISPTTSRFIIKQHSLSPATSHCIVKQHAISPSNSRFIIKQQSLSPATSKVLSNSHSPTVSRSSVHILPKQFSCASNSSAFLTPQVSLIDIHSQSLHSLYIILMLTLFPEPFIILA